MLNYKYSKQALAFLKKIPAKHAKQITGKVKKLAIDPESVQSEQLEGFPQFKRFKSGEYRVIFRIDNNILMLLVLKIGKRNDGEVYRHLENLDEK